MQLTMGWQRAKAEDKRGVICEYINYSNVLSLKRVSACFQMCCVEVEERERETVSACGKGRFACRAVNPTYRPVQDQRACVLQPTRSRGMSLEDLGCPAELARVKCTPE